MGRGFRRIVLQAAIIENIRNVRSHTSREGKAHSSLIRNLRSGERNQNCSAGV